MRVGTKLLLSLAFPIVIVMGLFAYVDQRRSRAMLREELSREGRAIALTAQVAIEDYLRDGKVEEVRDLVVRITGYERVLGMRVYTPDGTIRIQSDVLDAYPPIHHDALARTLAERTLVETRRRIGEEPVVTFLLPLLGRSGELLGAVQVLQLESFMEEDARASRNFTFLLTAVMFLATGAILLVVTRLTVTRSVHELVRSFRELGSGDLSARVSEHRTDEFGHIAREFNKMCERLERSQDAVAQEQEMRRRTEAELRTAEKLASLGRVAAGLAHEIGTPLNVIGGRAEVLERHLVGSEPAVRNLRIITGQIDRISRIVRGFLDFARARNPRLAPTDVEGVLRKLVEFMEQRCEDAGVRVELRVTEGVPSLPADADQLYQVFLNLMANAVDPMPDGGRLTIEVALGPPLEGAGEVAALEVRFTDTGPGIPPEERSRVFEPFHTTKDVGKGTGLGLAVAYGIARAHGGTIELVSENGHGACFLVRLPLGTAGAAAAPAGTVRGGETG